MQTPIRFLFVFSALMILLSACSRKKDTFLSRNYHAVTAEYNALYNGEVAFESGRDALIDSYQDNFWEILPVERIESPDFIGLPGQAKDPNFERAEEKAIKAIQKHSITIDGKERNPQIDEAFMLLGKARYYDQRFVRALEAFNYILAFYPASNSITQAKIWKEKTNIRLNNEVVAIENLSRLLNTEKKLDPQEYADASAMLAQAYLNLNRIDSALVYIDKAAYLTRKNEERGRYNFIKAQLYDAIGQPGLANETYDRVIDLNRRSPRRYMINAYIAKTKNFDYESGDERTLFELLSDLEANRENRPYLDRIYNQFAESYLKTGEVDSAISYFNRSLKTASTDRYLVSRNYLSLGDLNFDLANYQTAGAYYDSTLAFIEERSREFRGISKKRSNLDDVILYEDMAARTDSILMVVAMSEPERRSYFKEYIENLKEKKAKDSLSSATSIVQNNEFFKAPDQAAAATGSRFYFYNPAVVAQGKISFIARWGTRPLEDNWRISDQGSGFTNPGMDSPESVVTAQSGMIYDVETYLNTVPVRRGEIDSLARDRNFAYYQLGLIYKEKFKEPLLAADRLESLLQQDPEERLILPAKYHLYQIYGETGDRDRQNVYREDILKNHADTRYAAIVRNPNTQLDTDVDNAEAIYNELYKKFEDQQYAQVLESAERFINDFTGDPFVAKFELLKATTLGRYRGFDAYKEALSYVALNYPNQDEGKKAQQLLENTVPQLADSTFKTDEGSGSWKLLYAFDASDKERLESALKKLQEYLEEKKFANYTFSRDVYDPKKNLLVIHGFRDRGMALDFAGELRSNENLKWDLEPIPISSVNYRTIQIHKNLEAYRNPEIN